MSEQINIRIQPAPTIKIKTNTGEYNPEYVLYGEFDEYKKLTDASLNQKADKNDISVFITENDISTFITGNDVSQFITSNDVSIYLTENDISTFITGNDISTFITGNDISTFITGNDVSQFITADDVSNFLTPDDISILDTSVRELWDTSTQGGTGGFSIEYLTQDEYDNLQVKDPSTLYLIQDVI